MEADRSFSLRGVYRAASQMGGTFSPRWREQRDNLKPFWETVYDFVDYKKISGWILQL